MATTEELHGKIEVLSDRIRELETALAILQSSKTDEPHPLLTQELLLLKHPPGVNTTAEEDVAKSAEAVAASFGTLTICKPFDFF